MKDHRIRLLEVEGSVIRLKRGMVRVEPETGSAAASGNDKERASWRVSAIARRGVDLPEGDRGRVVRIEIATRRGQYFSGVGIVDQTGDEVRVAGVGPLRAMPRLPPIDVGWVRRSIAGSFAQMYLTLLSIIQGVALAVWAMEAIPTGPGAWDRLLSAGGWDQLGFRITTLLALVVVWHSYFWLAVIARWIPSIWDSLLMFAIGATEFVAILNMEQAAWFYAMGTLGLLGAAVYWYNAGLMTDDDYAQDPRSRRVREHVRHYKTKRAWVLLGISGAFLLIMALLDATSRAPVPSWWLLYPLATFVLLVVLHIGTRRTTLRVIGSWTDDEVSAPEP